MADRKVTEGAHLSDVVAWEEDDYFSREEVTINASQTVVLGSVLEASGAGYVICATCANAAAVALAPVTTGSGATAKIPALVRESKVLQDGLCYLCLCKATVDGYLKAKGIIVVDPIT